MTSTAAAKISINSSGIRYCNRYAKQNKYDIPYLLGILWDKVIDFADERVVKYNVSSIKNVSLDDDGDNNGG